MRLEKTTEWRRRYVGESTFSVRRPPKQDVIISIINSCRGHEASCWGGRCPPRIRSSWEQGAGASTCCKHHQGPPGHAGSRPAGRAAARVRRGLIIHLLVTGRGSGAPAPSSAKRQQHPEETGHPAFPPTPPLPYTPRPHPSALTRSRAALRDARRTPPA